ncbi:SDR family oxidoreductase [Flavobacterium sp. CFBP9031]|uniref:SDR family oxidoreductase n=1 Tax=Flavobacterium sp. CFBP9031 TaxID=3096538 RepID=UPI002A6AA4BF|nr:SDR family oxidoreductase [Flavobacterium sp. CFBP9031]MDY0986676.1 SDR family oxidoreductase [Flavobacterium sp. CFBP9031]
MSTKSKIALVTGGSRGLGRDMIVNLAKNGNNIIFTYHSNKSEADKVVSEVLSLGQKAVAYPLDLGNIKTFDSFVQQVSEYLSEHAGSPNFDYLINNAGVGLYGSVTDTTEDVFDTLMNIHFKGVYFLTQKLLPLINDGGRIINISSGLTRFTFPNVSAYASMKGAIETYTRSLAKELGSRQITANSIAPGAIATDFGGGSTKSDKNKRNAVASITALGRVGEPEDIGGVVAFLCTSEAGWVNAQRIELSGGMMV